jgi:hypothetical protein
MSVDFHKLHSGISKMIKFRENVNYRNIVALQTVGDLLHNNSQ